jgi:hypothetical protein
LYTPSTPPLPLPQDAAIAIETAINIVHAEKKAILFNCCGMWPYGEHKIGNAIIFFQKNAKAGDSVWNYTQERRALIFQCANSCCSRICHVGCHTMRSDVKWKLGYNMDTPVAIDFEDQEDRKSFICNACYAVQQFLKDGTKLYEDQNPWEQIVKRVRIPVSTNKRQKLDDEDGA